MEVRDLKSCMMKPSVDDEKDGMTKLIYGLLFVFFFFFCYAIYIHAVYNVVHVTTLLLLVLICHLIY